MRKAIGIGSFGAIAVVAIMLLATFPANAGPQPQYLSENKYDIWAGKNTDVGDVWITHDGNNIYLKVHTTGDWYFSEVHIAVADSLNKIPQKNGNPPPGQFPFKYSYNSPGIQFKEYTIPITSSNGWDQLVCDKLYVAIHLVVNQINPCGGIIQSQTGWTGNKDFTGKNWAKYFTYECKCPDIPSYPYISGSSVYPSPGPAYWNLQLWTGINTKDGTINAWCLEEREHWTGSQTAVSFISSYDFDTLDDFKFNSVYLDDQAWCEINWVINHHQDYTNAEIQGAIWALAKSSVPSGNSATLVQDAQTYGQNYHPYHGGIMAVIIRMPNDS